MIAISCALQRGDTQLFQFFGNPVRVEVAAAYAMPLLVVTRPTGGRAALDDPPQGLRGADGQGRRAPADRARPWRWAVFGFAMLVATLSVFLPYLFCCRPPSPRHGAGASGSTTCRSELPLRVVRARDRPQRRMAQLSLCLGQRHGGPRSSPSASPISSIRRLIPFATAWASCAWPPFVIPGVVLAIGFYAAYAPPPLALYGTAWILILAFTTRFLADRLRQCQCRHPKSQSEMEEAVRAGRQPAAGHAARSSARCSSAACSAHGC